MSFDYRNAIWPCSDHADSVGVNEGFQILECFLNDEIGNFKVGFTVVRNYSSSGLILVFPASYDPVVHI